MIRRTLFLSFFLILWPIVVTAAPIMVITDHKVVLEKSIMQGETAQAVFEATNTGDEELVIKSVTPGCGCTVASHDQNILPGGKGKITLKFNSSGYSGKVTKSALVQTNAPEQPETVVSMTVTVIPILGQDPEKLIIKTKVGQPESASMVITVNIPDQVIVKGIGHSFGEKAKMKLETIELGKKYRVTLMTEAKEKVKWSGRVLLDLKGGPIPRISLPAFIEVNAE